MVLVSCSRFDGAHVASLTRGLSHILRRLAVTVLPTGYAPVLGIWLAASILASYIGFMVGSTRSVEPIAAVTVLLCGLTAAAIVHHAAQYVAAFNVLLVVLLPEVLGRAVPSQLIVMLLAANVGVLVVAGIRGPLQREDLGLLVLLAAVLWPYAIGGPLATLPGAVGVVVLTYATGRSGALTLQSFVTLLLVAGAIHGAVAIAQSVPPLSGLVPFQPMRDGVPFLSGRATGLFNNPNTLGTLEAVILVVAIRVGIPRWTVPLVVLCAAGLILSSSREAAFGLLVGLSLFGIHRFRQMAAWLILFVIVGGLSVWAFPSLLDRLDPTGYATDPNLVGRVEAWGAALNLVGRSPLLGFGTDVLNAVAFVDNAYIGWMLAGGVAGLCLWILGSVVVTPRLLWPVLAAMLAIATLANPFSGPTYGVFLMACGAVTAGNIRQRLLLPADERSRDASQRTVAVT
jgi:hypothetical protein